MPKFAILKRLSTETLTRPDSIRNLNREVREYIEGEYPQVKWIAQYGLLGDLRPKFLCPGRDGEEEICVYDYLEIFEAPDRAIASKVVSAVLSFGHTSVELWGDATRSHPAELVGGIAGYLKPQAEFEFEQSKSNRELPLSL